MELGVGFEEVSGYGFHHFVSPIQGEEKLILDVYLGLRAGRFTPGYHISGFQPARSRGEKTFWRGE
jgi:hypothetical protein